MFFVDSAIYTKRPGGKKYCHLYCADVKKLHEFAEMIGRKRCWFHKSKTGISHYDLDEAFRAKAVLAGAIEVSTRDIVLLSKQPKMEEA